MAFMMKYEWKGVTPAQYDAVRAKVGWLDTPPPGGRVHVVAFNAEGLQLTDVWDSIEEFEAFLKDRLESAIAEVDIPGEPTVEFIPLHEVYVPVGSTILATPAQATA